VGAICLGGPQSNQPFTKDGFWVHEHGNGTLQGFPFNPANESATAGFELPDIFFRCPNPDACRRNNTCDGKYDSSSRMCMQCAPERHNFLGFCLECPGGAFLSVIEWILVISLWQAIQYLTKVYPTLDLLLLYCQCLSIIQGFNVPWPQNLYMLTMIMSVVNFNMDAITPACAGVKWDYYYRCAVDEVHLVH